MEDQILIEFWIKDNITLEDELWNNTITENVL